MFVSQTESIVNLLKVNNLYKKGEVIKTNRNMMQMT